MVGEVTLPNSPEIEFLDLVSSPDGEAANRDGSKRRRCSKSKSKPIRKGSKRRTRKRIDRSYNDDDDEDEESFYNSFILYKRARRSTSSRCTNSRQQNQLDTNMFESYLEVLWKNTSEAEKKSFTYLDSLWFSLYKEGLAEKGDQKEKVLRWIVEKQIFSCNYVFVPIVCWRHWNLLILCHIGESICSKTKRPCMLLLDSLEKTDPKRLEPDIRRFVWDIYKMSPNWRLTGKDLMSKIPLLVPKVPQQRNGDDCGVFVLYFIYLFLKTAPEVFSLDHYPYFLTRKWFNFEELEGFRKELLHKRVANKSIHRWCYHAPGSPEKKGGNKSQLSFFLPRVGPDGNETTQYTSVPPFLIVRKNPPLQAAGGATSFNIKASFPKYHASYPLTAPGDEERGWMSACAASQPPFHTLAASTLSIIFTGKSGNHFGGGLPAVFAFIKRA